MDAGFSRTSSADADEFGIEDDLNCSIVRRNREHGSQRKATRNLTGLKFIRRLALLGQPLGLDGFPPVFGHPDAYSSAH
jgi:hypothetical protein